MSLYASKRTDFLKEAVAFADGMDVSENALDLLQVGAATRIEAHATMQRSNSSVPRCFSRVRMR